MRKTLIAFAAVATAIAAPAAAQDAFETITVTVETQDLDLTNADDRERLDQRIDSAIRRACDDGRSGAASQRTESACRSALRQAVAPQVDVALLDAGVQIHAALELSVKA